MSIRYLRRGRHSAVCISTAATPKARAAAEANVNSDIHMARSLLLVLPQSPIERAVNAGPIHSVPGTPANLLEVINYLRRDRNSRGIGASRYIPVRDEATAAVVAYF
jgi:hypothetical protein